MKSDLKQLLTGDNNSLVRWIRSRRPELSPSEIRGSLRRADIQIEFPAIASSPTPSPEPRQPKRKPRGTTRALTPKTRRPQVSDLIEAGLIIPPLELERMYRGIRLTATIQRDGRVAVDGQLYDTLSAAAGISLKPLREPPPRHSLPTANGWTFWRYRDLETGSLEEIDLLRQQYLARS